MHLDERCFFYHLDGHLVQRVFMFCKHDRSVATLAELRELVVLIEKLGKALAFSNVRAAFL